MLDLARAYELFAQPQLALQHADRARGQHNPPIIACLCRILVEAVDAGLGDIQRAARSIIITGEQRNFLRRPQASEEAELVIVGLCVTPVAAKRGDQDFGFGECERINNRSIFALDARALEFPRWVMSLGMIAVAKVKCAPQDAERVTVGLLAPRRTIGNLHERGVPNIEETQRAKFRPPDAIQNASIRGQCDGSHVMAFNACRAMGEKFVKDLDTGPRGSRVRNLVQVAVVREFLGKAEGAGGDTRLDAE